MWQYPISIISYLAVAICVVFFSIKLSTFVDLLDKKTNLSGALLGGILLAATTSLPELFTALTATLLVKNNDLVLGDILGSNLFNIVLFSIIYLVFYKKMIKSKVDKAHLFTMGLIGLAYAVVTIAGFVFDFNNIIWFGWFNPMSVLIVVLYAIAVWKTPKEEINEGEDEIEDEKESQMTVKQIAISFAIFAVLLIASSIGITYLTQWVVDIYQMGSTFGGALFLGVATSLPELTATINLGRRGNINAAFGNIIGSNIFNFSILALADVLSFNCPTHVYTFDQSAFLMLIFGIGSTVVLTTTVFIKRFFNKDNKFNKFYFTFAGIVFVANYIAFLILSNINLYISFAPFRA